MLGVFQPDRGGVFQPDRGGVFQPDRGASLSPNVGISQPPCGKESDIATILSWLLSILNVGRLSMGIFNVFSEFEASASTVQHQEECTYRRPP